eukprot:c21864_g1_i3 orf=1305-2654(-)
MGDENWTVVVRRRASKPRAPFFDTSARHNHTSSASQKHSRRAPKAPLLQADDCDEALLLLKMKRSMDRVQECAFFKKFLDQLQSPPVLDRLRRAASDSNVDDNEQKRDGDVSDEGKILARQRSAHESFQDITLQIRNSTADSMSSASLRAASVRSCESARNDLESSTEDSVLECASASLLTRVEPCESFQNDLECGIARTCNCRNCSNMERENLAKVCCSRCNGEVECACRNAAATARPLVDNEALTSFCAINTGESLPSLSAACRSCQKSEKLWCLRVVLYGLGSIADSEISRYQFALILLLKQRFSWVGEIEVYDPVLSQSECKVIETMGCVPIAIDEKGRRSVSEPTLFYMPHCEDWLYDNVLQANWVPHILGQLVILGNSFQDYQERWSSPIGGKSRPPLYVIQYQQLAQEIPLEATSSSDLPGFNNMSWHFYEPCNKGNSTLKF